MNSKLAYFIFPIVIGLLIGCASVIPKKVNEDSSGIGIVIRLRSPILFPKHDAEHVYFARFNLEQDRPEDEVWQSNYRKGGRVYLLNLPPGDYAAVAASFNPPLSSETSIVYFSTDVIKSSRVSVKRGQIAYAGSYVIDMSFGICPGQADENQIRFAEAFSPGVPKCRVAESMMGNIVNQAVIFVGSKAIPVGTGLIYHYRGSLLQIEQYEYHGKSFLMQAREDLSEGGWNIPVQ